MTRKEDNYFKRLKCTELVTPRNVLFIFAVITLCIESLIIIYSNLVELRYHLGFDASSAYLQAVEIWRCKSLIPSSFALTTTLGLDSPVGIAALLYGITKDIFISFGLTNIILDAIICFIFYKLLKEFHVPALETALAFVFLLCPFMTPDHFTDNNLSYYAMVLGEQGSYSVKIIAMLLLLLAIVKLEHKEKCIVTIIIATLFNILTSISSGIYVAITILVPCIVYYIVKLIYKNSYASLKNFGLIFVLAQLFISFACKSIAGHIFTFESKESSMVLTGIYDFWHNVGSIIMGYFQLFGGLSINTSTGLFSFRGIIQLISVAFILLMLVLFIISIKHLIDRIKNHDNDFTFALPYIIIFVNIAIFIFSYTLYDGYFFEYRYLIIVYIMQIIICCTTISKISGTNILKNLMIFSLTGMLLLETVGIFRLYHEDTIDTDTLTPMLEKVDSLDVPIAYVWGTSSARMQIDARNFRVMDLNVVYRTLTDETYKRSNQWGDYLYYDEHSQWTGKTALITTAYDYTTLPEFITNKYTYVDTYGEYMLFKSLTNPFDLSAFDNNCTENINFMYSDGVDILENELDSEGNLVTDTSSSGIIMNMMLPDVNAGTYSITLDYETVDSSASGLISLEAFDAEDVSLGKESKKADSGSAITLNNITVNETTPITITCSQSSGQSLKLKKVTIIKLSDK
ncbi:MAG: hypothetical protein ACI4D1_08180 [Lachnospira sp.]